MRDAQGLHKVGSSVCALGRRRVVQYLVTNGRRPVRLIRAVEVELGTARAIEATAQALLWLDREEMAGDEWFRSRISKCWAAVDIALALGPNRRLHRRDATSRGEWFRIEGALATFLKTTFPKFKAER